MSDGAAAKIHESHAAERVPELLDYWFSTIDDSTVLDRESEPFRTVYARWYGKDPEIDAEIRSRFEDDLIQVTSSGRAWNRAVAAWSSAPKGLLALLLLVDQLPRNMYRGTARMYAYDALALSLTGRVIHELEREPQPPLAHKMFAFVPLLHVEDRTLQEHAVWHFETLARDAAQRSPRNVRFFEFAADYARRHLDVIVRFGRFPHRNAIVGRQSTPEEQRYLERDDAGF